MTDKTLDGFCCKKDKRNNPHTLYVEQETIPVLIEDCKQGAGVKYLLADVAETRIKELERHVDNLNIDRDNMEIGRSLVQDHLDLMVDEFKRIKSCPKSNDEIKGLCVRAIKNTEQRVPLIRQRNGLLLHRDDLEARVFEIERQNTDLQKNNTDLVMSNRELNHALDLAIKTFKEYEMDVDCEPTIKHISFMRYINQILKCNIFATQKRALAKHPPSPSDYEAGE